MNRPLLLGALLAACLARAAEPSLPPPLRAEACAACHPAEAAQWRRSIHATSHTNALYLASYNRSRLEWCMDCHAPRLEPSTAGIGPRTEGIDCAACHVRGAFIVTSIEPTEAGQRAHPEMRDPALGTAESCAGCHQFNVPKVLHDPVQLTDMPMQSTLHEWQGSGAGKRGTSCQSCHMPRGSHDMQGGHDAELLRRTVDLRFSAAPDGGWVATLESRGAGHRVPTGDPFRRFEVLICATAECDDVFTKLRFGRLLRPRPDGGWVEARDTSVPAPRGRTASSPAQHFDAPACGFFWKMRYRMDESGLAAHVPRQAYEVDVSRGRITVTGEQPCQSSTGTLAGSQ